MNLTRFGSAVRKARIDSGVTLSEMAEALQVTPAFLSSIEVGRKKIPEAWVKRVEEYFESKGLTIRLAEEAMLSNKTIPLAGFSAGQQAVLAGFARRNRTDEEVQQFMKLISDMEP